MIDFTDTQIPDTIPPDTVPPLNDVECPCRVCGKEAGPYSGRGPKPKLCPDHKKTSNGTGARNAKVTGAPASLAAQATQVLVQLNGIFAIGCMALGFNDTASAIAGANGNFEEQAYAALLTDSDLCKLILKGGVKSAKMSLGIAYIGLGTAVGPTAYMEFKEKRAEALARKEAEDAAGA